MTIPESQVLDRETSHETHEQAALYLLEKDKMPTQLAHGSVELGNTEIKYTIEFPEERTYDGWAMIEPGFGGFKQTSRSIRHELAERGIATCSYGPARGDDYRLWDRLTNSQELHERTVTAITDLVPQNPDVIKKMPGGTKIDFSRELHIPHSMGGLAVAPHAKKYPSRIDAIVNLAAAGYGSPNLPELAAHLPQIAKAIRNELIPYILSGELKVSPVNAWRIANYYLRNPARTVGEMADCLRADVRPTILELGEKGIKSAFIAFEYDCLVPPSDSIDDVVDIYDVMPDSGHLAPQLKPQKVADFIVDTLHRLEEAA